MFNSARHKMIGKVLEFLESFEDYEFDNSGFFIDIELRDKYGDYKVLFEDESGEWEYKIVDVDNGDLSND